VRKPIAVLSIAALMVATAIVLSSCGGGSSTSGGGSGKEGGTLKGAYTSFPDYLDPQLSYTAEGWTAMYNTYVPLLTYKHANGEEGSQVIPGLAESLPKVTNGGKTYTLKLRKGLEYSNGMPVKASDFKFAVERMFKLNSGGSPFFTDIVGAEQFSKTKSGGIEGIKTNDQTGEIVINLVKPRGTFNNELALMFTAPVPPNTPEEDQSANPPPATGPYEIVKSEPGRGWSYDRNPAWKKSNEKAMPELPSGHLDKIEIEVLRNQSTQVNYVQQGKLNWIFDPPPTDRYQEVKEKYEGTQFRTEPTISTYYFWMNEKSPTFSDVKVRQAVNYAIDSRALERIYTGQIVGTQQILPPGMPGYEKFSLYPHDMEKAKQLIKEANPSDMDITVWTDSESPNNDAGTYYQGVLKELGFNAELKIVNADNYFTIIGNASTPNLDTGWTDWFEDYPHPNDFFQPLLDGESIQTTNNQNFSNTSNSELDKKIEELGEKPLDPGREKGYAELDKEFMEEAPWAPYGTRTLSTFVSSDINLDGIIWNPTFEDDLSSIEFK
jgi:peptide/nickel transport system substrate-binding protein